MLPGKFVDHTHADAVISITNTENGADRIHGIYGGKVVIIPYVMSGFLLARTASELFSKNATENTIGMVVMNHGIFSFGESAGESYERMIALVEAAEQYLKEKGAWDLPPANEELSDASFKIQLADLRKELSHAAGRPLILSVRNSARGTAFARRGDATQVSQHGPATPDHVIYTKRIPMLGKNAAAYRKSYEEYFEAGAGGSKKDLIMLDPAPRVILDPELGLCTAGRTAKEAGIAADLYEHTVEIILRAEALGGYRALSARDIFNVEYWEPEQAKLLQPENLPVFTGEVALVTGAASGIGRACVDSFLTRGAAVIGLDLDASVEKRHERSDYLGIRCDLTSEEEIGASLEQGVRRFGGLDMLVLNAGIFPASREIADLPMTEWRQVMNINMDANLSLLRECHPLLKAAPNGGRVVVIGSKNVPAPGKGAGAYSASKAALTQLARVAAMEWGGDGIRINTVHPNAVFDTGVWTEEVLASRAKSYDLSVEEYKKNNLLKVEVRSQDVAEMAAEMCGPLFAKTTAAQVPVDGGNDRVV
jgi:NAD(P)-dependent dehydrogenase (short-subunit alcohol dehydrogenase family)/ribulose-5-phosphate 4-epimerase/fuculose-1-phosphate aldolase